jgi:hypothetical protein
MSLPSSGAQHIDASVDGAVSTTDRRARIRNSAYIIGACTFVGIAMAGLWIWFAPRPFLVASDGNAFYQSLVQSGIGVDMTFAILGVAAGFVVGIGVAITAKRGGFESIIAAGVGGLAGSVIAWRLGEALVGGLQDDGKVLVPDLADGEVFTGPLRLTALGVLGVWSLTVTIIVTSALVWRASRAGNRARHLSYQNAVALSESNPAG